MREQPFLQAGNEHRVELQALRRVHAHHLQRLLPLARLVLARLERRMGEERGERVDRLARLGLALLVGKGGRGVGELRQVLDAILALALGLVVLDKAAARDDVLDHFRQRQVPGLGLQVLDQLLERSGF